MRGKRAVLLLAGLELGLIPAHAGKTPRATSLSHSWRAHPRACGENLPGLLQGRLGTGSSPRMRGKLQSVRRFKQLFGLIPAHAGKTAYTKSPPLDIVAHPRACGENTERSGVLTLRSVRSWKTLSFPSSLKITHCRAFVQLSLSRIRL